MFCAQGKTNNELAKWFLLRLAVSVCLSPIVINGRLNAQDAVDNTTLYGKFMCGYQGWFRAPGDGSEKGWVHWFRGNVPSAANLQVDLFPDLGEFDPDELFDTNMHYGNGSVVKLYSACVEKTVLRHFQWMQDYNAIDAGATMLYGAMFDEVDEGTALYKICPNRGMAPAEGYWLTLDADGFVNLPSDWYLRLSGLVKKMLKREILFYETMPLDPVTGRAIMVKRTGRRS